jgi:two-component sensor histidine kinase
MSKTGTKNFNGKSPFQKRWKLWGVIFLCWTFLGFFFSVQNYLNYAYAGKPAPVRHILGAWLGCFYLWALLTPVIINLARRFPLERGNLRRNLAIHLLAGIALSILQLAAYVFVRQWLVDEATAPFSPVKSFQYWLVAELHSNLLLDWSDVGLWHVNDYHQRYRERERRAAQLEIEAVQMEAQLTRAQLDALKMQIHPHFLFNTLNSISVLMREDVAAANRMLVRLSELLRAALKSDSANEVTLRQELDFLRGYLEIEQTRFQDRLRVEIKAAPETFEAKVPNLILQPLVENAIRHAVAPRDSETLVEIRAERRNGHLQLIVRDDGEGFVKTNGENNNGIGLANTRARLEKLYGEGQEFTLAEIAGGGVQATITIPFHTDDDNAN